MPDGQPPAMLQGWGLWVWVWKMKLTKDDIERICGSECNLEEFKQILQNQKLRELIEERFPYLEKCACDECVTFLARLQKLLHESKKN